MIQEKHRQPEVLLEPLPTVSASKIKGTDKQRVLAIGGG
jgi:hypothetical protein